MKGVDNMDKWQVVFRSNYDRVNNRTEILACYREYNPYYGIQCIPMYKIHDTIIQESHTTLSLEYYYTETKLIRDFSTIEEYKRHLERWYNEPIEPRKRLIRKGLIV